MCTTTLEKFEDYYVQVLLRTPVRESSIKGCLGTLDSNANATPLGRCPDEKSNFDS